MDNKQVALLAPTTILAQQHYNTFVNRFGDFPIKIEVISRFKTRTQQRAILKALKEGNIDIIIGTHRLLGRDVIFKDLGLLIVDEEQRFGVGHKETIKNLKKNLDVLTLTATPIPRTLHMSLVGIRDISTIETPPEDRIPVQTYVVEYTDSMVRDAILREVQRGGQVYFVYNRVRTMERMAERLRELVPDIRIRMAHGQMSESILENVMMDFYDRKFDLLVCSTIIESGLDIPNVNTIIVYDADYFGLSQLYQLRGRVGRSNRMAYAYLTYRKDKILSEVAEKRLRAIKEFTEFGAGFKIAMRDLEIRGSGNILGPEQHGHMTAVGYELYCKLLDEAIKELKGEEPKKSIEPTIEIKVNAYIGSEYIPLEGQKIEIYKKIGAIGNLKDKYDVEDELEDRFGDIPSSVANLVDIAYIKALAGDFGITEISHRDREVILRLGESKPLDSKVLMILLNENMGRLRFEGTRRPRLRILLDNTNPVKALEATKDILEQIQRLEQHI
jgi:transcription-repair coupling factor (superfamily II helicase)